MIESFYCAAMRHTAYGGKKGIDYVFLRLCRQPQVLRPNKTLLKHFIKN
jgi:hypothetical protein